MGGNPKVGTSPYRPNYYGGQIALERGLSALPAEMANPIAAGVQGGPNYFLGGLLTYEKPLREFPADINVAASSNVILKAGDPGVPRVWVGFRIFITGVSPADIVISVNGGGARTVQNGDVIDGAIINSVQILTGAAATAVIQPWGTGD